MNEGAAADQAHARLQAILKAVVVGRDVADAASREAGESETLFQSAGALVPPYDPEALCLLVEHSNALRQNLDAYAVNIDGFGHRLEPAIDFEAEDADARVADAIFLERAAARERGELDAGAELEPTGDEVAARKRELIHLARIERARLQSFFDFCCFDHSCVDLRRRTRQDLETTGNAFWEVLRDGRGELAPSNVQHSETSHTGVRAPWRQAGVCRTGASCVPSVAAVSIPRLPGARWGCSFDGVLLRGLLPHDALL